MTNAEIITALRCCASLDTPCKGLCSYHGVEYCLSKKDLDAADALEAAEKRIADLSLDCELFQQKCMELEADKKTLINVVKDKSDFHTTKDAMRIADLEARLTKIKSQIYDLESMAKHEYDDDRDNEYLEGYFDGLHQAAKELSTAPTVDAVPVVRCKDCKHWDRSDPVFFNGVVRCECKWHENEYWTADGFCSAAERNNSEIPNS